MLSLIHKRKRDLNYATDTMSYLIGQQDSNILEPLGNLWQSGCSWVFLMGTQNGAIPVQGNLTTSIKVTN